jgi:hypothetical protein
MVVESPPSLFSALGGKLYAEIQQVAAALPTPYVPHPIYMFIDPRSIGGV